MENLETIIKNIGQSKHVAIVLPQQATVDAFCAAFALQAALLNGGVGAMVLSASPAPELPFLPNIPTVANGLSNSNQLTIKISNKTAEPKELRYEKAPDGLTVFITSDKGQFTEKDVEVLPSAANFDLVVIIGASNFEQLGKIYTDNTKLFFETPHINIDTNPTNEFYGTLNFVNTSASSLAEVVMDVIEAMPNGLKGSGAQGDIVTTGLLAGIISQTASFRDPKTTPSALQKASRLVAAGARQQDIIQHLFKTKPLPLLQLWGRALARISAQPDKQALTAVVTASDLEKTQMPIQSLPEVLRDILEMVTGYSLVGLLAEIPGGKGVQVLLAGLPFEKLTDITAQLSVGGSSGDALATAAPLVGKYQYVSTQVSGSLADVQTKLSELIEKRTAFVV